MDTRKNTKKAVAPQEPQTVIYLGPSLKNIVLTGTIFNNGLPPRLEAAKTEQPAIGELLIPIGQAVEARKQLAVPGSALRNLYESITRKEL